MFAALNIEGLCNLSLPVDCETVCEQAMADLHTLFMMAVILQTCHSISVTLVMTCFEEFRIWVDIIPDIKMMIFQIPPQWLQECACHIGH